MVSRIELNLERLDLTVARKVLIQLRWRHFLRYLAHKYFVLKTLLVVQRGNLTVERQSAAGFPFS